MRHQAIKAKLRTKLRLFYVLCLLLPCSVASADDFNKVVEWQKSGAYELALRTLDQHQPSAERNLGEWLRWERQRYALYQSLGRWKAVLESQQTLPANIHAGFRLWAETQAIHALLALNDTETAFKWVQRQIWANLYPNDLQLWRALLVQVYAAQLEDGAVDIAWRRYRQDALQSQATGNVQASELMADEYAAAQRAYARTLIRQERYQDALREVIDDNSIDGRLLFATAQLLVSGKSADEIYGASERIAESGVSSPAQRRQAYGLMARAAARQKNHRGRVAALVNALSIPVMQVNQHGAELISVDELWSAYESWGRSLGLSAGLSPEYEKQWASGVKTPRTPDEQVAMASVLVLNGRDQQSREASVDVLLQALSQLDKGAEQTLWLLNDSERLKRSFVDMPDVLLRASLRAALRVADLHAVKAFREHRGVVLDPLADQANGVLDVHARLLIGAPAPAVKFVNEGLDNLSAWFKSSQMDLLMLLHDLDVAGHTATVAEAAEKLAKQSAERDIRMQATELACGAMLRNGNFEKAGALALTQLSEMPDAEANNLAMLAYEALWRAGLHADAEQIWHRYMVAPEVQTRASELRRRLQLPTPR